MAEGRKYGRLQYGAYSYDLQSGWFPIPPNEIGDIWIPIPESGIPSSDIWGSIITAPTEIWIPVTIPRFK